MPSAPYLGDVRALDRTTIEVLTAGFPCHDISAAGRRVGIGTGLATSDRTFYPGKRIISLRRPIL
jgi:site-specific DNA-cytosine methylase